MLRHIGVTEPVTFTNRANGVLWRINGLAGWHGGCMYPSAGGSPPATGGRRNARGAPPFINNSRGVHVPALRAGVAPCIWSDTMSKDQSTRMTNEYDPGRDVITWKNGVGSTIAALDLKRVPGFEEVAQHIDPVAHEVILAALVYGFEVKVSRAAALGIENGVRPTWGQKSRAMEATIDALYAGSWNAKREAGSMLYLALQRLAAGGSKRAAEYVAEWVGMDDDEKARIGKMPTIIREIAEIRASRAKGLEEDEFAGL